LAESPAEALLNLQNNGQSIPVHMYDTSSGYAYTITCNCGYTTLHAPHPHHTELIREGLGAKHQFEKLGSEVRFPPLLGSIPYTPLSNEYSAYSSTTNQYVRIPDAMSSVCNSFQNCSLSQPSYTEYEPYSVQQASAAVSAPTYATNFSGLPVNTSNGVVKGEARELVLGNLSKKTKDKDIEKLLNRFKFDPVSIELKNDPATQKCKGKAIVTFSSLKHANQVYKHFMQNKPYCQDKPVTVQFGKNETPISEASANKLADGSLIVDSSMYR
jgi:RNA recognition motif-containing protein